MPAKKKLHSRRYDDVVKLWRSIIKNPSATTEEKTEAARQLQAILLHQDKIMTQRAYTETLNPTIPTDPAALEETIARLKQAAGGA